MHDIKFIRDYPAAFDAAMERRGLRLDPNIIENLALDYAISIDDFKSDVTFSDLILKIDEILRTSITDLQSEQQKKNQNSKKIGALKRAGLDASELMTEAMHLDYGMGSTEATIGDAEYDMKEISLSLPNILDSDVPDGKNESDNLEIRSYGEPKSLGFKPRDHVLLGEFLGMMDFAAGAKLSGSRFVVLKSALARLERALAAFMLDTHTSSSGYQEIVPPALVNSSAMQGTGQLPKFADDLFQTTEGHWLIPTAEVPLTNLVSDSILDAAELPLRFTAYTQCFRAEAGAAGRDTRGMIRQHQFSKVELVSITHPDESTAELERMTACAESILQKLKLPYRVMLLSSGDTGFSAKKTYDIEVWLPGQNDGEGMYREISSCSNCGDFQARRMKARFRNKGDKATQFVHTLNGSGLAIGRTMIAVLENYQNADGSITVPDVLKPYMGGLEVIGNPNA